MRSSYVQETVSVSPTVWGSVLVQGSGLKVHREQWSQHGHSRYAQELGGMFRSFQWVAPHLPEFSV